MENCVFFAKLQLSTENRDFFFNFDAFRYDFFSDLAEVFLSYVFLFIFGTFSRFSIDMKHLLYYSIV